MIAVDTNVLIRILIDDPEELIQSNTARQLAKNAGHVYVPQIVQAESVWVLESCYTFDKSRVIAFLEHLEQNTAFILQRAASFRKALQVFKTGRADFSDCLIVAESQDFETQLYTFDKQCKKLMGARWIKPQNT